MRSPDRNLSGFSLVEMAIVLVIMGLLLTGGLTALNAQIEQQKLKDTQRLLEEAREALYGYAIANDRLPCPATAASNGVEVCAPAPIAPLPWSGFLPAVTLGLAGVDNTGQLKDGWASPVNGIRYAVTSANTSAATTASGIRTTTMPVFAPDLRVCASSTGITPTTCGAATALSNEAVAIIYSLGKNAPNGSASADETANQNGDRVFISHTPTAAGSPGGEYDDISIWVPRYTLYSRMLQAGRLP